MTETNEPRLRFKGFDEEWDCGHISDIGVVKMNKRIHKKETSDNGEVPFFKIGTFGKTPDAFITRKRFLELKDKYPYPKTGDILISASGTLGKTVVYKGKDEYFQDSNIIWLDLNNKKMINPFLLQFYNQHRWQSEGTTIKRLYNKDIYRTLICYPGLNEQQKIGSFFAKEDKIIELQTQKLEQLKKLKQGYLKNMFPQDGEDVPRLRFSGFSGEWKEVNLGEVVDYEQPTKFIVNSTEYSNDFNVPVLTAGKNFLLGYTNEGNVKSANENDPVIIFDDFTTGSHFVNFSFKIKSSAIKILKANDNNDTYFMYCILKNINYVPASHSRQWISNYRKMTVRIPTYSEQNRLSLFFKTIDQMINKQSDKVEALKQQKKAYLQKMFI